MRVRVNIDCNNVQANCFIQGPEPLPWRMVFDYDSDAYWAPDPILSLEEPDIPDPSTIPDPLYPMLLSRLPPDLLGFPSHLGIHLITSLGGFVILTMCFYNTLLKSLGFTWFSWSQLITKPMVAPTRLFKWITKLLKFIIFFSTSRWMLCLQSFWRFLYLFSKHLFQCAHCDFLSWLSKKGSSKGAIPHHSAVLTGPKLLLIGMTMMGQISGQANAFQLSSDLAQQHRMQKYRNPKGGINISNITPGDLVALNTTLKRQDDTFKTLTNNNPNIISTVVDTGASWHVSKYPRLCIPGSLRRLDQPIPLEGIAGGHQIEYTGRMH